MKLKYILLALLIGFGTSASKAQDYDVGIMGGLSGYQGDLAPGLDNGLINAFRGERPAIGGIYRYNFHPHFSVRGNLNIGWVAAYDKYYNKGTSRESRNLSFNSPIVELSGTVEYNILRFISGSNKYKWTPYLFGGFGLTYIHPMAWYNGKLVNLRPLTTETGKQGSSYSPIQAVIPVGGGLKFSLKNDWVLGVEAGWRIMFTDYLDDVSTNYTGDNSGSMSANLGNRTGKPVAAGTKRGNPGYKDSYFIYGITLTKTLRPYKCR
ncbi:MAG: outer membrane beta-barrel protein [Bacteroidetes bacterium]|nr:outer membrane beta-barrel protein [Bacteroidota bacterium]